MILQVDSGLEKQASDSHMNQSWILTMTVSYMYLLLQVDLSHITPLKAHLVAGAEKNTEHITPLKSHHEHCFLQ